MLTRHVSKLRFRNTSLSLHPNLKHTEIHSKTVASIGKHPSPDSKKSPSKEKCAESGRFQLLTTENCHKTYQNPSLKIKNRVEIPICKWKLTDFFLSARYFGGIRGCPKCRAGAWFSICFGREDRICLSPFAPAVSLVNQRFAPRFSHL